MLPPHRYYYLHNFQRALAWVGERYADLLDECERRFMADFAGLPLASQALLVRMLMRRGPWFRASRLAYEEIPDSVEAAAPLLALGWLDADTPMTLDELFALHTRPELDRLFAATPAKGRGARRTCWPRCARAIRTRGRMRPGWRWRQAPTPSSPCALRRRRARPSAIHRRSHALRPRRAEQFPPIRPGGLRSRTCASGCA